MDEERVSVRAWIMLILLGLLYVLSFIDRFILALLVGPLRAELALSDVQLGLLFGTFFAMFYGLLGVPLARIADRSSRKRLIIGGVLVWCSCTIASGFATNYATLAALRFGLAMGEAALTPAAFSLLTDAFPARRRVLAATLFSTAGMVGASAAFVIGALVVTIVEPLALAWQTSAWRLTLIAVGLPGFLLALLFAILAQEPGRGAMASEQPSLRAVWAYMTAHGRLYLGLFGGAGASQTICYALIGWSPALLERKFALTGPAAGAQLSVAQFIAAVGGTLIIPIVIRHVAERHTKWAARLTAIASAIGALLIATAVTLPTLSGFLAFSVTGNFLLIGASNAVLILIQSIAPSSMRATFTALILICISSVGLGLGPPAVAIIAQAMGQGPNALGTGLLVVALIGFLLTTTLFGLAARPLAGALQGLGGGGLAHNPTKENMLSGQAPTR